MSAFLCDEITINRIVSFLLDDACEKYNKDLVGDNAEFWR